MTDLQVRPAPTLQGRNRQHFGYWAAAMTYLALQAFTTVPSPLYARYAQRDHLTPLVITVVYAAYAVGVSASLVMAGHLSDLFGRRPVLGAALIVDVLSALTFLVWPALPGLFVARVLCGLAVGVTSSTATAYLGELYAARRPTGQTRRLQVLLTAVSIGGLGVGPLIAGLTTLLVGRPLTAPYVVMLVVFAACGIALMWAPETRCPGVPRPGYHVQRISVPRRARRHYVAALTGVATVFALFGLFIGLAGTILGSQLGHPSIALTGVLLFVVYAAGVASVVVTIRLGRARQVATAGVLVFVGLALLVLSTWLSTSTPVFLALFLCAGSAIGAGGSTLFTISLAVVNAVAPRDRQAETLAGFFLAGYVALSVPVIGVGLALQSLSVRVTLVGFAVLVTVAAYGALSGLLRTTEPIHE